MSEDRKNAAVAKIQKMLALAHDPNASEGERDNAARMASNMMAKYQIEEADLNRKAGGAAIKLARANARHMNLGFEKAPAYTGFIALGVAEFTETVVKMIRKIELHTGIQTEVYQFSGEIRDVKYAVWLCETLCYMGLNSWKKSVCETPKFEWLNGWGAAVQTRLFRHAKIRRDEESSMKASDSNALVVLSEKVALVREKCGAQEREEKEHKISTSGWETGFNEPLPLNRPLGNNEQKKTIQHSDISS